MRRLRCSETGVLLKTEALLWLIASLCACYYVSLHMRAHALSQQAANRALLIPATQATQPGEVIGRLTIPQIGLDVPVLEDDDIQTLRHGVGHIRGTAQIGGLGTVGLAGHRDTFLRPIRRITPKMVIHLTSSAGDYRYLVDSTEIVLPDAVRVLDLDSRPTLTIITCYPFNYVGAAPKRFIVHAHLISLLADGDSGG